MHTSTQAPSDFITNIDRARGHIYLYVCICTFHSGIVVFEQHKGVVEAIQLNLHVHF
jgi:hypothetical protein